MIWTTDRPNGEGWYFYRKRAKTTDPFYWQPYFVELNERDELTFWQDGTAVPKPEGGEWASIDTL